MPDVLAGKEEFNQGKGREPKRLTDIGITPENRNGMNLGPTALTSLSEKEGDGTAGPIVGKNIPKRQGKKESTNRVAVTKTSFAKKTKPALNMRGAKPHGEFQKGQG